MRTVFAALAVAAPAAVVGCGQSPPPAAVTPPPASAAADRPSIDSPEYANWKKFPVGTTVRRRSVTSSESAAGTTTSVETFTLKAATADEVVVVRQNTTERSDGSYRVVNPPEERKYPRRFALPPGMTADDFARPSRAATKTGDEVVTVGGKPYPAEVWAWEDHTEGGAMGVRVWVSDAMPGRVVRQEMVVPRLKNRTVEEVTEVVIP